ncbi:MAG: leucyl/phenylalanyl-tRNA--protein transferase [Fimbriimonadaceae bacterium]|nr:leucyl/phenylalanyl-tRNA--protein transferase [Fimbriimonadaceae bacterium]QYK54888.1 MAG: leucyl/phenylalanyl-tRNA--protein transferase [Fimbriimonadaceae bacterium]
MLGADLTPDIVLDAYLAGMFPMGEEDEVFFCTLPPRAVVPLDGFRVSRSLRRRIRSGRFTVTFDQAFAQVMEGCARPEGTWITPDIHRVYGEIHRMGWGHSVEVWEGGELVGGCYGLALGGAFCAESMFHRRSDASKVALWALVEWCRGLGFVLFDAQQMSPHLKSLGGQEIGQFRYLRRFYQAARVCTPWSLDLRRLIAAETQ